MKLIRFAPENLRSASRPSLPEGQEIHLWILRARALADFRDKRSALKEILSSYTGKHSSELSFLVQGEGKPALPSEQNPHGIFFNLSHSGELQVIAIARYEVGIDVEKLRPFERVQAFMDRFFLPSERRAVEITPEEDRLRRFFEIWTAKEAWAKARGLSVFRAFSGYECSSVDPFVRKIELDPGYVGHVAVRKPDSMAGMDGESG